MALIVTDRLWPGLACRERQLTGSLIQDLMPHVLFARSNGIDNMLKTGLLRTCRSPAPGLGHQESYTTGSYAEA